MPILIISHKLINGCGLYLGEITCFRTVHSFETVFSGTLSARYRKLCLMVNTGPAKRGKHARLVCLSRSYQFLFVAVVVIVVFKTITFFETVKLKVAFSQKVLLGLSLHKIGKSINESVK